MEQEDTLSVSRKIRFSTDLPALNGSPRPTAANAPIASAVHENPVLLENCDHSDETEALLKRIAELETTCQNYSVQIETLLLQKKEYDLLRQQSSKGFKSMRNLLDSPVSARSGKDQSYMSGKEIIFAAKSPRAPSSTSLPSILNPSASDVSIICTSDKDETIRDQAAQIARLNEKLEAMQHRLQLLQPAGAMINNFEIGSSQPLVSFSSEEVETLRTKLSEAELKIAKLEAQNHELMLQQEQFKLLREQSSPGFKLLQKSTKGNKSIKLASNKE